jgi:signal transduction histidine kinase/ActR/RegA family two-component response regulator
MDALAPEKRADAGREDHSDSALRFIHELLSANRASPGQGAEPRTLAGLLSELARAFDAAGAGLSAPLAEPALLQLQQWVKPNRFDPIEYPWETRPQIVHEAKNAATALALPEPGMSWLVTTVWPTANGGWLLWLQDEPRRQWSPAEQAALPLAGQALARLVAQGGAWGRSLERLQRQRHVETAAAITGRLAHDFGNVLTGILGFAELSLTQLPANSVPHRYVNEVLQSAQQGANWVRKLQLFSRRSAPQAWPTALAPILHDEAARLRKAWGSQVALLLALADDLPPVAIDAESFRQMVVPLLDNAREAIDGPGVVTVSARVTDLSSAERLDLLGNVGAGPHVEITITDTGRGLSPNVRARLFDEMFFSTKPRHRGLGLAVVFGLVQAFRGGLRLGPDPAQGAAVHLFLPCPTRAETSVADGKATPILVVDDDPMILDVVCKILDSAGYAVQPAANAKEALSYYGGAREPVRLVVTDINMPGLTGLDLVGRLQQLDPSVNALFISSLDTAHGLSGAALLQQFGVLPKPFEPEMLLAAVKSALARGPAPSPRLPAVTEEAWQA